MADKEQLKPDDFPLHAESKKIVKPDGKDIAEARTPKIAEDVAERLNAEEDRRDWDRERGRDRDRDGDRRRDFYRDRDRNDERPRRRCFTDDDGYRICRE